MGKSILTIMASNTGIYQKNGFTNMKPSSRTWLNLASLRRSWLAFARSCIHQDHGKIIEKSWQDIGKAGEELAMGLVKNAMASNTGMTLICS